MKKREKGDGGQRRKGEKSGTAPKPAGTGDGRR